MTTLPNCYSPKALQSLNPATVSPSNGFCPANLSIYAAQPRDFQALAELLTDSFHSLDSWLTWLYPLLRLGIQSELQQRLQARTAHYVCLVAIQQDLEISPSSSPQVLGTVELGLQTASPWQSTYPKRYPYISNLAVHSNWRNQGIAQQLLQTCEQITGQWGYSDVYLHVLDNNVAALNLYQKLGYQFQLHESHWNLGFWQKPQRRLLCKSLARSSSINPD
jgi:ribosomal protein S18 acetylase RimI-like enzyme